MTSDPNGAGPTLEAQAQQFADELTTTVHAVAGTGCQPFRAQALGGRAERLVVQQAPDTGVPLTVDGEPLLTLKVEYRCVWDSAGQYLAVDKSKVVVHAGSAASGEPLFRYEYIRNPGRELPGAHVQIHAHRDGIAHVMTLAGRSTRRARRRADAVAVPAMRDLHFPVGGARFRPCLEDVLEMLVCELGVDCDADGREALAQGRLSWRRGQLRSSVRDSPEDAAKVLAVLGYTVTPPVGGHPPMNAKRLTDV